MNRTPILQGKHAVVFGAGGSFGSVVAREFAAEGAEVFLSGRSKPGLEEVARHITADGGLAHVAVIDAEDPPRLTPTSMASQGMPGTSMSCSTWSGLGSPSTAVASWPRCSRSMNSWCR